MPQTERYYSPEELAREMAAETAQRKRKVVTRPPLDHPMFSEEAERERRLRQIDTANRQMELDEAAEERERQLQPPPVHKPQPFEEQFAYWDSLMAHESKLERAVEDYDRRAPNLSLEGWQTAAQLKHQLAKVREQFLKDRDDPDLADAYEAWHQARFGPQEPEPAAQQSPGLLKRILSGISETAKYAVQHPLEAARDVHLGVQTFASLPFRAIEGLTSGGKGWSILSPSAGLRQHEQEVAKSHEEAGVEPRGTGPTVLRSVGEAVVPVGPTFKAGQAIRNILKGGAFTGSVYGLERASEGEPVDVEGVGASGAIGGGIGALASLLSRGRVKPGAASAPSAAGAPSTGPGPAPAPAIPYRSTTAGTFGPEGVFYGPPPPPQLPAPEPPARSHYREMIERITSKPASELTPEEKGFLLHELQRGRHAPPNVAGKVESVGDARAAKVSEAAKALSEPPAPLAYPGSIYGLPGVKGAGGGTVAEEPLLAQLLRKSEAKPVEPVVEAEVITPAPAAAKPAPPPALAAPATKVDEAMKHAEEELLSDVIKGKKDVNTIPVQRSPKAEAPKEGKAPEPIAFGAPAKKSSGKFAGTKSVQELYEEQLALGKSPEEARDFAEFKTNTKLPPQLARPVQQMRLEDFIKAKGYKIEEKEPFPGEKSYNIIDPKTGNTIARGDREAILNALNALNERKGIKLYSFPANLSAFQDMFEGMLDLARTRAKVPPGVAVENQPAKRSVVNKLLQPFETPEFLMRKYAPGLQVVEETKWAERQVGKRLNDLLYEEVPGGGYVQTNLFRYFEMPEAERAPVDRILVLGDKIGKEFSPQALQRAGLTPEQIDAYLGVREALTKVRQWIKTMPGGAGLNIGDIPGYIPRVWHGNIEIFVNGAKHLKPDGTSSFETLRDAGVEAYRLKQNNPGASVAIRFFADPEYLGGRAFQDAQVISRIKRNLEKMGSATPDEVDRAYEMGRSLKGFVKHLEKRKNELGYETEGLDKILFNYFHQASKMIEMRILREVVKKIISDHARELTSDQIHYLQNYVERVAGRPTWDQIWLHDILANTRIGDWLNPVHGSKALSDIRQLVNHLTLGLGNISWALVNVDSLIRHAWPALQREANASGMRDPVAAEKYLARGIKEFFTNPQLRQKLAHWGVVDIQHMSEKRPQVGHVLGKGEWTPGRVSMALGTATEEFVRGVSAIARYRMAKDLGAKELEAMQAAARFVDETSGRYSRAGKPAAFTGALGETIGMYKTYMSVFAQNAWKAFAGAKDDPGAFVRYMMATLGVSGLLGLPGVDDLDELITRRFGWSPIEAVQRSLPQALLTGLASVAPGWLGLPEFNVDLSKKAGMPDLIPDDLRSALGPVVGRLALVVSDLAKGEYKEAALDLVPNSIRGLIQVLRGTDRGVAVGRYDKPVVKLRPGEEVPKALGFPPIREIEDQRVVARMSNLAAYRDERLRELSHKMVQGTASPEERREFRKLGGSATWLKGERLRERLTTRERQFKYLPKILKREAREAALATGQ